MKRDLLFQVAEYIRLSREDGDKTESDSISNQRKLIADYLKGREEFVVYDTYLDDGFTGTNFNRPGFCRMMGDIEAGKINCVIVKDLSRFGRDYIETGKYLERYFPDKDIRFISITDNIDSFEQTYDMLLPIKNIFNEQYARDISKKIHASVQTKQRAGEFIGAFASYGYQKSPTDKNKLVVDEYAAEVVRRIFDLYNKGYGKNSIAEILNREGIVCPSEYKRLKGDNYRNAKRPGNASYWTYSTINRILQNEMYIGNMVQGKKYQSMRSKAKAKAPEDWIVVQGTHEAIITAEVWEKTQNLLERRMRDKRQDRNQAGNQDANRNIFAGFLKCGDCGRSMVKKGANYYCGTYVRSGRQFCTPHSIACETLEQILRADLQVVVKSVDNRKEVADASFQKVERFSHNSQNAGERKKVQAELDKLQKRKKDVYEDYREELISREECVAYRKEYLQKEELLKKQLESLEKEKACESQDGICGNPWIKRLLESGEVEKLDREMVATMLQGIWIYENDKIEIVYPFCGASEIPFASVYGQKK